jgi:hypothetical protein
LRGAVSNISNRLIFSVAQNLSNKILNSFIESKNRVLVEIKFGFKGVIFSLLLLFLIHSLIHRSILINPKIFDI